MKISKLMPVAALLFATTVAPLMAQDATASPGHNSADAGIFSLIPPDYTTQHQIETRTALLEYSATAGTIDLFEQSGAVGAKIFYTAYRAHGENQNRPLTFVFNGGPGAASAYLHMGLAGPRIVELGPGKGDGTTPELTDNPETWLRFTDLIFIDPVGTGWSRAATADAAERYWGIAQDAESLAKFIALYVQKQGRLASPKYLLGESYGGFRAAKVATSLKNSQSILVSGVIMVSPLIDSRLLSDADDNPLIAALHLPSLAAAEFERRGTFSVEGVRDAERFAMTDYLVSLAGAPPARNAGNAFYTRVSELTGLSAESVAVSRGYVAGLYAKQSGGEGNVVSPYDAGQSAADAYPGQTSVGNDDVILDGYTRAYGGAFSTYARDELKFRSDITYTLLNRETSRKWDWGRGRESASAAGDLRDLLSVIPSFRLAILHGYSDVLTPFGASRYVIDQLPLSLSRQRTSLHLYRGGHMFYGSPVSRAAASEDARLFYDAARSQ